MEDLKASPQGSGSPGTPSANDRAAAKRADLRRQEQERRRREAVRILNHLDDFKSFTSDRIVNFF